MRKRLEFMADRIEAVLALHKIPARVTGGTVTPRWVRFQVLPAVGAKLSRMGTSGARSNNRTGSCPSSWTYSEPPMPFRERGALAWLDSGRGGAAKRSRPWGC